MGGGCGWLHGGLPGRHGPDGAFPKRGNGTAVGGARQPEFLVCCVVGGEHVGGSRANQRVRQPRQQAVGSWRIMDDDREEEEEGRVSELVTARIPADGSAPVSSQTGGQCLATSPRAGRC